MLLLRAKIRVVRWRWSTDDSHRRAPAASSRRDRQCVVRGSNDETLSYSFLGKGTNDVANSTHANNVHLSLGKTVTAFLRRDVKKRHHDKSRTRVLTMGKTAAAATAFTRRRSRIFNLVRFSFPDCAFCSHLRNYELGNWKRPISTHRDAHT